MAFIFYFFKEFKNKNILIFICFILIILVNIITNNIFSNGFTYFKFLKNIFADGESTIFYLLPFRFRIYNWIIICFYQLQDKAKLNFTISAFHNIFKFDKF